MSIISKITNKILNNSLIEINENDLNKTLEQLFVPNVDNILKSSLLTAINFTGDDDYALLIRCLTKVLKQISEFGHDTTAGRSKAYIFLHNFELLFFKNLVLFL